MILEITLAIACCAGPPTIDVDVKAVLPMPIETAYALGAAGIAWTPHVAFAAPIPGVAEHELHHLHQWGALGPALPLAYAATAGRPFEDYLGDETFWQADDPLRCPLLRVKGDAVDLLPCYRL